MAPVTFDVRQSVVLGVRVTDERVYVELAGEPREFWISEYQRGELIRPGNLVTLEMDGDQIIGVLLRLV